MHFIWLSMYLARKYYLGTHIFYVSNWRRNCHFTWSSEPYEGLAACSVKGVPSFLSYFKTLNILVPTRESNLRPPALHAVKHPTDWANTAAVRYILTLFINSIIFTYRPFLCLATTESPVCIS